MQLHHEFTVPVPVDEAWRALLDIERVAPCMPGATVDDYDGKTVTGGVKVKVGPVTVTYRGTAVFEEQDETAHRIVLAASGKEVRGQGTARATVTGTLAARDDGGTAVAVDTELTVTGRPAQFGRGVMADVGDKIIGQFADCLSGRLTEKPQEPQQHPQQPGQPQESLTGGTAPYPTEPIDLLRTAGIPVAKRAAAGAAVLAVLGALVAALRRFKKSRKK
ncbi:SRPBCC family protein [Streptomyces sp. NPDC059373]